MKLTFLGTGASPSMPIPFCACQVCTVAQKTRGKNLRRRSSIMINHDLLVDIGPDIMTSCFEYQVSLANISYCLQTHFHEDHFDPEMIISRHKEYGTIVSGDLLIAGSVETLKMMDVIIGRRCGYGSIFDPKTQAALRIKLLTITPFETYNIGNYKITGYPANHGSNQGCLLYSIAQGQNIVFYGTDTSIISEEVWGHFLRIKQQYDVIILDHTYGIGFTSKPADHMASRDFILHVERFLQNGLLRACGRIYATHISHEGIMEHDELDDYASKYHYRIAYDGLTITLDEYYVTLREKEKLKENGNGNSAFQSTQNNKKDI